MVTFDPSPKFTSNSQREMGRAGIFYRDGNIKRSLIVRPNFVDSTAMQDAVKAAKSAEILIGFAPGHFFPIARNHTHPTKIKGMPDPFTVDIQVDPFTEADRKTVVSTVPFGANVPDMSGLIQKCPMEPERYENFPKHSMLSKLEGAKGEVLTD